MNIFSQIYEGWRNNLLPPKKLKQQINQVSKERMGICEKCTYHSEVRKKKLGYKTIRTDVHCTHCGCTLSAKTKCLSCSCPLKLWKEVMTEEEEDKLNELIDGKQPNKD